MDCSCLASLTVVIGEPVRGVVIKDGCGEWRQDWVNRKRQERWKAVVLMRCPEERSPAWRRLFFTLFVTQVSCPAQLGRWEATPSLFFLSVSPHTISAAWRYFSRHVSYGFVCVALLYVHVLCLLLIIYRSEHCLLYLSVCLSVHLSSADYVCVWIFCRHLSLPLFLLPVSHWWLL